MRRCHLATTEKVRTTLFVRTHWVNFLFVSIPGCSIQQATPASSNPDHVLCIQGKKRHSIIGDGNCHQFRALAYIVYGTEDVHAKMRSLLVDFVSKNQPLFQPLVISGKLEEHIQYMLHSRQWGTQVELQAASTLFQMDLYTL